MKRTISALIGLVSLPAMAEEFSFLPSTLPDVSAIERYEVHTPKLPQGMPMAVGSGLRFKGYEKGTSALEFWSLTDRGPNVDTPDVLVKGKATASKLFVAPDFTPTIAQIRVSLAEKAAVIQTMPIKQSGKQISGLPVPSGSVGATGEVGLDRLLNTLSYDVNGLDPEGIDFDAQGNLWIVDEYGPFIAKIDGKTGEILKKYGPGVGLPAELAFRQPNRGFEGVAVTPSGKVVATIQSTLDVEGKTKSDALFTRIVVLDPANDTVKQYAYPVSAFFKKAGDMKIGDIVAISETKFALIEQGKDKDKQMHNDIVLVDLSNASDIQGKTLPNGKLLEFANAADVQQMGVQFATKKTILDLRKLGWKPEKSEGLALVDGTTLAVINDNDFAVGSQLKGTDKKLDELVVSNGKLQDKSGNVQQGASLSIEQNDDKTELWLITLRKSLKDWK